MPVGERTGGERVAPVGVARSGGRAPARDGDPVRARSGREVRPVPALAGDGVLDRDVDGADAVRTGSRILDGPGDRARPAGAVVVAVGRKARAIRRAGV